jgi:hypothetical protein
VGDLVALVDAAHVGATGLAMGFPIRFLISQDARMRGDSHDEVPMEPTMYGRLASTMTTTVSRRRGTPDGDDGDNEPIWSLEPASSWARLDTTCGSHALTESEPIITTASAMLPPQPPTGARAGCVAEARSNNEQDCSVPLWHALTRSRVPLSAFVTDIFPKLQVDISERDNNLLRFAKLAHMFSNRAWPESRHFVFRLGHGALALFTSNLPTSSRMSELRDKFHEHLDAVFRVAFCRVFGLPPSRILSTFCPPTACASCNLSVQAMRGAFASAGVDMSDDAWATACADHLARCGVDASVHTAHSWLVTALAEIISEVRGALGVGVVVVTYRTMLVHLPNGNDSLPADVRVLHYHGIRGLKLALEAVVSGLFCVSSPPSPEVALCRPKKTNVEKYSEGMRICPDIRFIPFAVADFWYSQRPRHGFFDRDGQAGSRLSRNIFGQVIGLLALKGFSRRPCRSRRQRLVRVVRDRRRCGGCFFLGWGCLSCHGALHPRHGPQVSPCFLERRVRRRLSPPRVAFSALPRSFLSLLC